MNRTNLNRGLMLGIVTVIMLGLHLVGQAADKTEAKAPASEAPAPSPKAVSVSAEDQLAIKNAELKVLRAQDALKSSPAYSQYEQAMNGQQEAIQKLVRKYHIDSSKYTLCDGPGSPPCTEVHADTVEFRALVQEEKAPVNVAPATVNPAKK